MSLIKPQRFSDDMCEDSDLSGREIVLCKHIVNDTADYHYYCADYSETSSGKKSISDGIGASASAKKALRFTQKAGFNILLRTYLSFPFQHHCVLGSLFH